MKLTDGQIIEVKWKVGPYLKPVTIEKDGNKLWVRFPYDPQLKDLFKLSFDTPRWDPNRKCWSAKDSHRTWFHIALLACQNPYEIYDKPLLNLEVQPRKVKDKLISPYSHQIEMARHILTRHYCIISAEMGTGKTLGAMLAMELSGKKDWFWVAPKSALHSVELEFQKWGAKVIPTFLTYEGLKSLLQQGFRKAPNGVIFDESQKIKNPSSQRSEAAMHLANAIRDEHGIEGYVVPMSGSPAPKSPLDWYNQCETACPGFFKEGHISKFRDDLALVKEAQSMISGTTFTQLITWLDDENKCRVCGKLPHVHDEDDHKYTKSENKVANLYKRMSGLVIVQLKKDLLDLPDKQYKVIRLEPSREIMQSARMITDRSRSTIQALTLLRELSDGFQYIEKETGVETCPTCRGTKTIKEPVYIGPEETEDFLREIGLTDAEINPDYLDDTVIDPVRFPQFYRTETVACPHCDGIGETKTYSREAKQRACPKEDALLEIIENHEDIGRLVVFAGFSGSIDRCVSIVQKAGWHYIRVDGRGWISSLPGDAKTLLQEFQEGKTDNIVFIGAPNAAGTGLTLTASPTIVYYSNDFNFESRCQSEDRIHRPGMDVNRGATIIDLLHLPTDEYVLDNLKNKRKLQDLSLGQVNKVINGNTTN